MKIGFIFLIFFSVNHNLYFAQVPKLKSNKIYTLTAIFTAKQKNTLAANKASLSFNTKTKLAKCFTGCNFIELKYKAKKNTLKFIFLTPNKQPCPDHLLGIEEDLKQNLPKVNTYKIINTHLYFFNNTDTLLIFNEQK